MHVLTLTWILTPIITQQKIISDIHRSVKPNSAIATYYSHACYIHPHYTSILICSGPKDNNHHVPAGMKLRVQKVCQLLNSTCMAGQFVMK